MDYFSDLHFYRFNHLLDHREKIDHCFETYAINFLASGCIHWQMNDRRPLILKAPCVYWTWPGPRFSYHSSSEEAWEHYFVSFTGSRPARWAKCQLFLTKENSDPVLPVTQTDRVRHDFDELLSLLSHKPVVNPHAVLKLESLLLYLQEQPSTEMLAHPRRDEIVSLIQEIETSPEEDYDFNAIAQASYMSPAHLRRLFKTYTGQTPVSFVNQTRLNHAAALLRSSHQPIKQIADQLGFQDVYYFTRLFKRQFKLPPAKYRQAFQRPT